MKKRNHKRGFTALAVFLISGLTLFAMGVNWHVIKFVPARKVRPDRSGEVPKIDPSLVRKMLAATRSLDFNRPVCTYEGVVNLDDPNDKANSVHDIHFLFCRSGSSYYYRLASVEIIHKNGLNIMLQHDQHKILVSAQQIVVRPPVKGLDSIMKVLSGENYAIKSARNGSSQTISLINEEHLGCKEFSVTVDTLSGKLQRIHARLSDFGSAADKGLDRVMDIRISKLSYHADLGLYPPASSVLRKEKGNWKLEGKYNAYELIML